MNSPANIRRDQYAPTVTLHLPGCEGEELAMRCSLLLMRDNATAALRYCSDEAAAPLEAVERLAGQYAFASMRADQLKLLRYQLHRLTSCASGLEAFAFARANPEKRETDARG
jgi:hypothetical protein